MANDPSYGKPNFPSMGAYLFSGEFLSTLFQRVFQGGLSVENGITAHAGGLQPSAYQLTRSFNRVATVATGGDSVALPKAIKGSVVVVDNNTASTSMNVFAKVNSGDTINGTAGTTAFAQAGAKRVTYICYAAGAWVTSTAAIP